MDKRINLNFDYLILLVFSFLCPTTTLCFVLVFCFVSASPSPSFHLSVLFSVFCLYLIFPAMPASKIPSVELALWTIFTDWMLTETKSYYNQSVCCQEQHLKSNTIQYNPLPSANDTSQVGTEWETGDGLKRVEAKKQEASSFICFMIQFYLHSISIKTFLIFTSLKEYFTLVYVKTFPVQVVWLTIHLHTL